MSETGLIFEAALAGGAVWRHWDRTDAGVRAWAGSAGSGIPEAAGAALVADETRPRVEQFGVEGQGGGTLINLRGANLNEGVDEQTVALRGWVEGGRLETFERYPIMAARDVAAQAGGETLTVGNVVSRLAATLIERLEPMVDDLDDRLYVLEDQAIDPDAYMDRRELSRVHREVISLRRYLAPQREAIVRLAKGEGLPFEKADVTRSKEASNHLARLVEDLDAAHERAQSARSEAGAQLEEASNRKLYLFTLVTIVFLPLSFLTGVFGMNVGGLPWTDTARGFVYAVGLMAVMGVGAGLVMVWRRWV